MVFKVESGLGNSKELPRNNVFPYRILNFIFLASDVQANISVSAICVGRCNSLIFMSQVSRNVEK